jgi:NTE family protein
MRQLRLTALAILFLFLWEPASTRAQLTPPDSSRPRIGLVLSGGGAKGLAHIGVIRALEELGVPIDLVTGTSMGALVGGLFASGYDGAELTEIVTNLDWVSLFSDQVERRFLGPDRRVTTAGVAFYFPIKDKRIGLPSGAIRGENIQRLLQQLTWPVAPIQDFSLLPTPFAAVTTNLETGEAVVLTSGSLSGAMRASMSLPGVFEPSAIEGQVLVDGGLVRNLPAQDARALGAEFLICSDVIGLPEPADEVENLVEVLSQSITFLLEWNTGPQRNLCDVLIRHDREGLSTADFRQAREWIELGQEGALSHAAKLREVAIPGIGAEAYRAPVPILPDSVLINRIEVRGVTNRKAERIVVRALAIPPPVRVGREALDDAVGRIYGTGLFLKVGYRIVTTPADTGLIVQVLEEPRDQVGLGFRYDDRRNASLLFTTTMHNLLTYGSTLGVEVRLGEQIRVKTSFLQGLGVTSAFGQGVDASFTSAVFAIFEKGDQLAEVRSRIVSMGGSLATTMGQEAMAGLRLGIERAKSGTTIAAEEAKETTTHFTLQGSLYRNTLDERSYPSSGMELQVLSEWATGRFRGSGKYRLNLIKLDMPVSLNRKTVFRVGGTVGGAAGDGLPLHHMFFLGGVYPTAVFGETQPAFLGLKLQERWGRAVQVFRLSLRREIRSRVFATAAINAGNAFPTWEFSPEDYTVGWGLSLGVGTPIGPVEATIHGRSAEEWPMLDLNVGFIF